MASDIGATIAGIPAAIGTQMLAEGEIKLKRVLTPKLAVDSKGFIRRLVERGFKVTERIDRVEGS